MQLLFGENFASKREFTILPRRLTTCTSRPQKESRDRDEQWIFFFAIATSITWSRWTSRQALGQNWKFTIWAKNSHKSSWFWNLGLFFHQPFIHQPLFHHIPSIVLAKFCRLGFRFWIASFTQFHHWNWRLWFIL